MTVTNAPKNGRRRAVFSAVLAIFALWSFTAPSFAATVRVTGRGSTPVLARRDAFRQAIEQRVGVLVSSRTLTAESRLVFDRVTASSDGWIDGYTVVDVGADADGCRATLDVEIDDERLAAAFAEESRGRGLVRADLSDPRVCVRVNGPAWATSALVEALHAAGFSRVSTGRPGPDGFIVGCDLSGVQVSRPQSLGFERDFTCTVGCTLRVSDSLGDVAMQTSFRSSAWSMTAADATFRAQEDALRQVSAVLSDWLRQRARTPERHLRVVMNGVGPADAQRLLERASGVLRVYVRRIVGGQTHLELDADCSAVELAMELEADGRFIINASGGSVYMWLREDAARGGPRRAAAHA